MKLFNSGEGNELSELSKVVLNCWQIWNDRNGKVFTSLNPIPARSLAVAASIDLSYFKANCKKTSKGDHTNMQPTRWLPPPQGCMKLNFDGSVSLDKAAAAFVLKK